MSDLYAAHWHSLVRLAYLMVHDVTLAEDIVQDALVTVHQRWDGLRDPHAALGYVRRTVINGARSALRHQGVVDRYARRADGERLLRAGHRKIASALGPESPRAREAAARLERALAAGGA